MNYITELARTSDHIALAAPESVFPLVCVAIGVLLAGIILFVVGLSKVIGSWEDLSNFDENASETPVETLSVGRKISVIVGAALLLAAIASLCVLSYTADDRAQSWSEEVAQWLDDDHGLAVEPDTLTDWRYASARREPPTVPAIYDDQDLVEVTLKAGPFGTIFLTDIQPKPVED
jgi:hypothetical protein